MHNINKRKELLDAGKTLKVILSAVTNKRIVYVSKIKDDCRNTRISFKEDNGVIRRQIIDQSYRNIVMTEFH